MLGWREKKKQEVSSTSKTQTEELQSRDQVGECRDGSEDKGICHQPNNLSSIP